MKEQVKQRAGAGNRFGSLPRTHGGPSFEHGGARAAERTESDWPPFDPRGTGAGRVCTPTLGGWFRGGLRGRHVHRPAVCQPVRASDVANSCNSMMATEWATPCLCSVLASPRVLEGPCGACVQRSKRNRLGRHLVHGGQASCILHLDVNRPEWMRSTVVPDVIAGQLESSETTSARWLFRQVPCFRSLHRACCTCPRRAVRAEKRTKSD